MKLVVLGLVGASMSTLTACTPPEPVDFSQNNVSVSQHKINCKLQSIAVSIESDPNYGNGSYGTRPPALEELRDPLQSALQDGLDRSAVFNYASQSSCAIEAKVLGLQYESFGATFPTTLYVSYEINNLDSGQALLSDVIIGQGETPMSYNLVGVVRSRHSIILSGQDAVRGMIDTSVQFAATENAAAQKNSEPQR